MPFQASRSTSSSRPSSASPAKIEMPISCASRISGGISGSIERQPETWKPPMQTGRPAARNGRARSTARGNWLDCTPTRPISALPPVLRIIADDPVGPDPPVGLVIGVEADLDVRAEHLAALRRPRARPLRQASVLEGMAERNHWIG